MCSNNLINTMFIVKLRRIMFLFGLNKTDITQKFLPITKTHNETSLNKAVVNKIMFQVKKNRPFVRTLER